VESSKWIQMNVARIFIRIFFTCKKFYLIHNAISSSTLQINTQISIKRDFT